MTDGYVNRPVAQRYLTRIVQRAKEINSDDSYAFVVSRLVAFGPIAEDPYLERFDSVDIGYQLRPRFEGMEQEAMMQVIRDGCPIGPMFSFDFESRHDGERWFDDLDPDIQKIIRRHNTPEARLMVRENWPLTEVLSHLRMRSSFIRLHDIDVEAPAIFAREWLELDIHGGCVVLDYSRWPRTP